MWKSNIHIQWARYHFLGPAIKFLKTLNSRHPNDPAVPNRNISPSTLKTSSISTALSCFSLPLKLKFPKQSYNSPFEVQWTQLDLTLSKNPSQNFFYDIAEGSLNGIRSRIGNKKSLWTSVTMRRMLGSKLGSKAFNGWVFIDK